MSDKNIVLSPRIFTIYQFFEKSRNINWKENPFKFLKKIHMFDIKIAKNISNLNFYIIDIPLNSKINPAYVIYYLKNPQYRNNFSTDAIKYRVTNKIDDNHWIEEETYNRAVNRFKCYSSKFSFLLYNDDETINNVSETKYYIHYIILKNQNNYLLRLELVLNNMDIDQEIDIFVYVNMTINILKAAYSKFKIEFNFSGDKTRETIELNNSDENNKQTQTLESYIDKKIEDKSTQISLSDNIIDVDKK